MTAPHDPDDQHGGEEEPWYGTGYDEPTEHEEGRAPSSPSGYDDGSAGPGATAAPSDLPTQPGPPPTSAVPHPQGPATVREAAGPGPGVPSGAEDRPRRWRSRRVRVGAAATLAGLVLLGGGFGAGYAVADASAPPTAAHATTAKGAAAAKGQAARKRRLAAQRRQQQDGGTTTGAGAAPGTTAGSPTF